eukprot:Tbor_TRINITY_DN5582_c1_g1::TRINITY_DN5582_c1_g1_i1::g.12587::m.12587
MKYPTSSAAEISQRINYPRIIKKTPKMEPLSCEVSRRVLAEYHNAKCRSGISLSMVSIRPLDRSYLRGAPESQEYYLETASQAQLNERLTEVLEHIATGGDLNSQNYLAAADILMYKGCFLDAVEYYSKCLKLDPLITECYLKRARSYRALYEATEEADHVFAALEEYKKYMQLEKGTKEIFVQSGKCALDAGKLDEAERLFNQCLGMPHDNEEASNVKSSDNDSYAHYNLGEVSERQCIGREGDTEYVRSCMTKAKVHYKHVGACFALPYYEQAMEEILLNRNYTLALKLFEAVAKMVPNDPAVHLWLAEVYTNLGPEFTNCVLSALTKAIDLPEFPQNAEDEDSSLPKDYLVKCPPHHQATLLKRSLVYLDVLSDTEKAIQDLTLCLAVSDHLPTEDARRGSVAIIVDNHNVVEKALIARARAFERRSGSNYNRKSAMEDYQRFVAISHVPIEEKGYPYYFLAQGFEAEGKYEKAGRYYALSVSAGYGQLPSLPSDHTTEATDLFIDQQHIIIQNDGRVRKRSFYQCVLSAIIQQERDAANIVFKAEKNSLLSEMSTDNGVIALGTNNTQRTNSVHSQAPSCHVYDCRGWMTHKDTDPSLANTALPVTVLVLAAGVHGGEANDSAVTVKDKGESQFPRVSAPVGSAAQYLAEQWIRAVKAREPTVHMSDEIRTLKSIIPHMQRLEKVKEDHEGARLGKGKKKR